jgi:cbb3-type cytochrome oxidase subunit 3
MKGRQTIISENNTIFFILIFVLVIAYSFSDTKIEKKNEETRGKFPIISEGFPYF